MISLRGIKLSLHILSDYCSAKNPNWAKTLVSRDFLRQRLSLVFKTMLLQRENVRVSFSLRFPRAVADAMLPPEFAGFYLFMLEDSHLLWKHKSKINHFRLLTLHQKAKKHEEKKERETSSTRCRHIDQLRLETSIDSRLTEPSHNIRVTYSTPWCVKTLHLNRKHGFSNDLELFACTILLRNLASTADPSTLRVFTDRSVCRRSDIDSEFDNYATASNIMYLLTERNMPYWEQYALIIPFTATNHRAD